MKIPGILIAAPSSGSGKTAVSCALMAALQARGLQVRACKCGPDYIDPMFHREVLGVDSRNLDLFFSEPDELRKGYIRHASGADLVVTEGVMGYYDGRGLDTDAGSSYDVARTLDLPVILVVNGRGAALSLAALVRGMAEFRSDSNIRGILLNRVSKMLYPRMKDMLEQELGKSGHKIPVIGYVPEDDAFRLESRHLGLVTPQELTDLKEQTERAGNLLTESVDLDLLLEIAGRASETRFPEDQASDTAASGTKSGSSDANQGKWKRYARTAIARVAIARDEAFCFYYNANLEMLEEAGLELVPFSPLRDGKLPDNISGLILGGGYPELYGERLSANRSLLKEIHERVCAGLPCLAECGGFMYLHGEIEDENGNIYPMTGVIEGRTYPTGRLVRFGYVNIAADPGEPEKSAENNGAEEQAYLRPGELIRGHEFHYWDSTDSGTDCVAVKPDGKRKWECIHMKGNLFAGYPHLYLPSMPEFAYRFADRCRSRKLQESAYRRENGESADCKIRR